MLQGQSDRIGDLVARTADLTGNLAARDKTFSDVLDSLSHLLTTVAKHDDQLAGAVQALHALTSELHTEGPAIAGSLDAVDKLVGSVGGLLAQVEDHSLPRDIADAASLTKVLGDNTDTVSNLVSGFASAFATFARLSQNGNWINIYACNVFVKTYGSVQVSVGQMVGGLDSFLAAGAGTRRPARPGARGRRPARDRRRRAHQRPQRAQARRPAAAAQRPRRRLGRAHRSLQVKPMRERNQVAVAVWGTVLVAAVVLLAMNLGNLPFVNSTNTYYADFANADGLKSGDEVRVRGHQRRRRWTPCRCRATTSTSASTSRPTSRSVARAGPPSRWRPYSATSSCSSTRPAPAACRRAARSRCRAPWCPTRSWARSTPSASSRRRPTCPRCRTRCGRCRPRSAASPPRTSRRRCTAWPTSRAPWPASSARSATCCRRPTRSCRR